MVGWKISKCYYIYFYFCLFKRENINCRIVELYKVFSISFINGLVSF